MYVPPSRRDGPGANPFANSFVPQGGFGGQQVQQHFDPLSAAGAGGGGFAPHLQVGHHHMHHHGGHHGGHHMQPHPQQHGGGGGFGSHHGGGGGFGGLGHNGGYGGGNQGSMGYGGFFSQGRQAFGGGGVPAQEPAFATMPVGGPQYVREERPEDQLFQDLTEGIDFALYDKIEVTVTPNNIVPAETFTDMGLHPLVAENVARCRYEKPTPVQKYGVKIVTAGSDLMACAQTGSGKTAAYLLPAVNHCLTRTILPHPTRQATPTALIMAPTRELCLQIYEEGRKFTFRTGLRCVVVYGGADTRQQIYELQRGCSILVATPGRLWEMFQRNIISFRAIQFLVLDEADRMLDMGFEPQIRAIVEGPQTDMPRTGQRQTLMYSATFPREIQTLAREFLSQHYFLQVGRVGSTTENISQQFIWSESEYDRKDRLVQLLSQAGDTLTLVFVEKKRDADYLERYLHQVNCPATSIHGDRSQREREEALNMFRNGMCRVLVATDVAARGLDIPNVGLIIQYDLPTNIDDYVHRIGRTGRAGKQGIAVAFFGEKNRNLVDDLHNLLIEAHQTVPDFLAAMVTPKHHHHRGGGGYRGGGGRGHRGFGGGFRGHRGGGGRHGFSAPAGGSAAPGGAAAGGGFGNFRRGF